MKEAISKDGIASGIELGPLGTMTLRVVIPWRVDGVLIGYIELGKDLDEITIDLIKVLCKTVDGKIGRPEGESEKLISYVKDRAGHDLRYAIDATKIMNELGWKPSLQFEEGLEITVYWYLENQQWLNNVVSGDYEKYYKSQYIKR